jgi:hypothetical protein
MQIAPLRWLSVSLCLAFLVVMPRVAATAPLYVTFDFPFNYSDLEFGPSLGLARMVDQPFLVEDGPQLRGPDGEYLDIVGGTLNFFTGPLLDVIPSASDANYIHAGGGGLSIAFDLLLPNGSIQSGTFDAPLAPFTIFADAEGGGGDTYGTIGAGFFDAETASLFGINRNTLEFPLLTLYLDSYDSYPAPYRVAQAFGYIPIPVVVPEPTLLSLAAMGVGAVALRYRRRTRPKQV